MQRLLTTWQFDRVRREGRSWSTRFFILNAAANGLDQVRCGFITGKKVGNAVQRNRARRRIRETVRLILPQVSPGWDLVWVARSAATEAPYPALTQEVYDVLRRGGLLTQLSAATDSRQSRIIGGRADAPPSAAGPGREP